MIIVVILRSRPHNMVVMDSPSGKDVSHLDKGSSHDSPFFAYLGHNAITESIPTDAANGSMDAVDCIAEHARPRKAMATMIAEPRSYNLYHLQDDPRNGQWRSYSYADTPNRQVSFDRVKQMRDEESCRRWSRRTVQFCGI